MLSNVILIPKAVSDKPERLQLYYSPHNTALSSIFEYEGGKRSVSVEAVRIDDITDENNLNSVKIMKVDTEGYDFNVLKGSKNTLSKTQYVIVEQNIPDTRKLLSDCGFKLSNFKPSGYLLATNNF